MQNQPHPVVAEDNAHRLFRIATHQGGADANTSGKSFQEVVLASLVDFGLRPWAANKFAGINGADAASLLRRAYADDGLLCEQAFFKGIVVPQLETAGIYTKCGTDSISRRDLGAVIEGGRVRPGRRQDLSLHIELKWQDSTGSTDDKAKGLPVEMLAGGADYCMVLYGGIGAVPGTHDFLHRAAEVSDAWLAVANAHEREPSAARCEGQFFYASTVEELVSQLDAIVKSEAAGCVQTYAAWREEMAYLNPSDTKTARQGKLARRVEKESAQSKVAAALTHMSGAALQLGLGFQ